MKRLVNGFADRNQALIDDLYVLRCIIMADRVNNWKVEQVEYR